MIELSRAAYDDVVAHARSGGDAEVCGVLAGTHGTDGERSTASRAHPADNVAETPETRYAIDPEAQLRLIESIEADGLDVVGFYHSHPAGPARPSETDVAQATWSGYSYVICALDGAPFVGSWRWAGESETFEQEVVAVGVTQ